MPPINKKQQNSAPPQRGGGHASHSSQTAPAPRNTVGKGWGAVAARKAQVEEEQDLKKKPLYLDVKHAFKMRGGDTVMVQILDDEPVCVEGCILPNVHYGFYVSQKMVSRSCPMVDAGHQLQWRACFKVLDSRGNWDKTTNNYENPDCSQEGFEVERYWLVSQALCDQLGTFAKSKGKQLSEMVLWVTRIGDDTKTRYNLEIATQGNSVLEPILDWEDKLPATEEVMQPLPKEALEFLLNYEPPQKNPNSGNGGGNRGGGQRGGARRGGAAPQRGGGRNAPPQRGGFADSSNTDDDLPY